MPNIAELFSQRNVLSYMKVRELPKMLGATLFPHRKIEGLEFDVLRAGSRIPTIASVHGFDTEAEIASRMAGKTAQEVALIKRKIQLKEKDMIALRNPRTQAEQDFLEKQVYNDAEQMRNSVLARIELMRMEVLTEGKVTINENGIDLVVDYGVPEDHKKTLDLTNAKTDIIGLFTEWIGLLDVAPTRILTSTKVRNQIMNHASLKDAFKTAGLLLSPNALNRLFEQFGLPTIAVYDAKFNREGANGKLTKERYFKENKLVFLGDGPQGETVFGTTPREARLVPTVAKAVGTVDNVYTEVYESSIDPVGTFTIAEATSLPSFPEAENVIQVTVTMA